LQHAIEEAGLASLQMTWRGSIHSARRRRAAILAVAGLVGGATLATAGAAQAHGLGGRADLPIPVWLFSWVAAVVLVISFVALGALWKEPRLASSAVHRIPAWLNSVVTSRAVSIVLGAAGVFLLGVTIWSGFAGTQIATGNFAPIFVYIIFWLGLVPASIVFGDVFAAVNPWRALGRGTGWLLGKVLGGPTPEPLPYSKDLGMLPATVGLFAFAWLELIAQNGALPRNVAAATLVYTCVAILGMAVYGVEAWMRRGEAFSVYFNLISQMAPFERRDGRICLRWPLSGLATYEPSRGLVLFVAIMIGSVSFDGLQEGPVWLRIGPEFEAAFDGVFGDTGARLLSDSLGLVGMIAIIWAFYRAGVEIIRYVTRESDAQMSGSDIARSFAPSLVPIGIAYLGAHFITLLLIEGQSIAALVSDPLGRQWDIFGTSSTGINFGLLGATNTWYLQVSLVVAGHVAGLVVAHDRALELWKDPKVATRSQLGMLVIMVGLTSFALWLLAKANA
jgi:hypothetical protein